MNQYSENQIKDLYPAFHMLKKYLDKLAFFDLYFGIIPSYFPPFDPALSYFFEKDKTELLIDTFKKERNNPALSEKHFYFERDYRFNIKPANSNSSIYSTYILAKFLCSSPDFNELINKRTAGTGGPYDKPLLEEANQIINWMEYKLQNEYDKSLKLHCMTVFYKGFYDSFCGRIVLPDKKRKYTELFLYAQGILYTEYLKALRKYYLPQTDAGYFEPSYYPPHQSKSGMLREFGIIDQFRKRYNGMDSEVLNEKLSRLVGLLTGESIPGTSNTKMEG
jgi:hypothetical protein